jgi:hypothetical protein
MYRAKVAPWRSTSWKPSGRLQAHHDRDQKTLPESEKVEDNGHYPTKE